MNIKSLRRIDFSYVVFFVLTILYATYSVVVTIPFASFWFDEGFYVNITWQLMTGGRIYTDVSFPYGPVLPTLYTAIFRLLSDIQFYYVRLAGLLVITLLGTLTYVIARYITKSGWVSLLSPLVLYCSLGLYQGCRLSASTLAGLWSLLALVVHLWDVRSPSQHKIFLLGALLGLSILTKHNIAIIDLSIHSLIIAWRELKHPSFPNLRFAMRRILDMYLALVIMFVILCYAFGTSPLDFLEHGFANLMNSRYAWYMNRPLPSPSSPWNLVKTRNFDVWWNTLTFYSPWLLLFMIVVFKPITFARTLVRDERVLLIFTLAYAQYLQMYPISDYSHYVRATIVFSVVPAYVVERIWRSRTCKGGMSRARSVLYGSMVIMSLSLHIRRSLKTQLGLVRNVLYSPPSFSALPYSKYLRKSWKEPELIAVTKALRKMPQEKMFIAGVDNVFYLLSGKRSVVKYSGITPVTVTSPDQEKQIIQTLKEEDISLILKCPPVLAPKVGTEALPILWSFIKDNYMTINSLHSYDIMVKGRESP